MVYGIFWPKNHLNLKSLLSGVICPLRASFVHPGRQSILSFGRSVVIFMTTSTDAQATDQASMLTVEEKYFEIKDAQPRQDHDRIAHSCAIFLFYVGGEI